MTGDLVSQRLAEAEAIIERGLGTFMDVGNALARVRDERLYRGTHGNFEDYCRARWAMSRKRAYDLMSAAETVEALSPIGDILPTTESQARELTGLPPAVAAEVMQAAAESGKVTAATIRDARNDITGVATITTSTVEHVDTETGEMLDGPTLAGRAAADAAVDAFLAGDPESAARLQFERNISRVIDAALTLTQFSPSRTAEVLPDYLLDNALSLDASIHDWCERVRKETTRPLRLVKES